MLDMPEVSDICVDGDYVACRAIHHITSNDGDREVFETLGCNSLLTRLMIG